MQRRKFLQFAALGALTPVLAHEHHDGAHRGDTPGSNARDAGEQSAQTVKVLTSFPEPMLMRIERAFAMRYPDIELKLLWRASRDALSYLQNQGSHEVDVYWAPAANNFHALSLEGRFAPLDVDRRTLPGRIGKQQLSDVNGSFEAVEAAGFAIVFNQAYLASRSLPVPTTWDDLADPRYAGHVALPVPSRIGFAPPIYEHWLQARGWRAGFELLSRTAANARLVSNSGVGVVEQIGRGEAGTGVSLDFFAYNAAAQGAGVSLCYPTDTLFSPAHIAVLEHARNSKAARTFVDFMLSNEGQSLLLDPNIGRLPIRPAAYSGAPAIVSNPFEHQDSVIAHDTERGLRRQAVVATLFDAAFTERHEQLKAIWKVIRQAEHLATDNKSAISKARLLTTDTPIAESDADSPSLAAILTRPAKMASRERELLLREWGSFFERNYAKALAVLA